ncbi:MAG: ThiF family adenylyltransferase [Alphaproteobacteria bacterium]
MLSNDQQRRYARHIVLPQLGEAGQETLLRSSVLVIGAGGLGSSAIAYLAASGVGRIGVVEPDRVELSNLQRQVLYEQDDIGRPKVQAVADRISEVNSECKLETYEERFTTENAAKRVAQYDLVVDGSDNFATRFAVSDACRHAKKPLVSAAMSGFAAQLTTFKPYLGEEHPCYRCLVPGVPSLETDCRQEGIIGPLAGMIGSMQALEAVKELIGIGESLSGWLLLIDGLRPDMRFVQLVRNPGCESCSSV